jgi:chaperonin GroEL
MKANIIKEITSQEDAKKLLIDGINKVADAVTSTLGYRGRIVLIEDDGGLPEPSKDGYNVLHSIHLENSLENLANQMLKEASQNQVESEGDGTTLVVLLTQAFTKYAHEQYLRGKSPIDVKLEIEKSRDLIIEHIEKIATPISEEHIYNIAKTSANSDEEIAKLVAEAYEKAGENGSVAHFRSTNEETYLEHIEGTLIESGYADEQFANVITDRTAVYENPLVVISHITFKTFDQIKPFVAAAIAGQKALVIVSEIDYTVQNALLRNVVEKGLPLVVVKPPSFGSKRRDLLQDLAIICGTSMISTLDGDDFSGRAEGFLGECKKITVGKTDTVLIHTEGLRKEKVESKISELKELAKKANFTLEKNLYLERIAKLSGGISTIKVGAITESELREKIDRVDDAVCAVRSAKELGVVAGGGVALMDCFASLDLDIVSNQAVQAPFLKILSNAGITNDKMPGLKGYPIGYDVKHFKEVDMLEEGIVDSAKAIISAVKNSTSVACTILLIGSTITLKRQEV